MANDLLILFPGKIDNSDPTGYPQGKAQNITSPGDGTGTPLEKAIYNDTFGMQQALLKSSGQSPSGVPDKVGASQYHNAIAQQAQGRARYMDASTTVSGLAILLTAFADQEAPTSYYNGMRISFELTFDWELSNTINIAGLGTLNTIDDAELVGRGPLVGAFVTIEVNTFAMPGPTFAARLVDDGFTHMNSAQWYQKQIATTSILNTITSSSSYAPLIGIDQQINVKQSDAGSYFKMVLFALGGGNSGGYRFRLTADVTATIQMIGISQAAGPVTFQATSYAGTNVAVMLFAGNTEAATNGQIVLEGSIMGGLGQNLLTVEWAQQSSNGTPSTIQAGSWMEVVARDRGAIV